MHVHANCAMSLDGCIGLPGPRPVKLSGPEDLARVHEVRARSDAILVGIGTVLADDPKLTVKWELFTSKHGKNPLRVVLDAKLRTPPMAKILSPDAPTLIFHGRKGGAMPGAELATAPMDDHGLLDLSSVLAHLEKRGAKRLMVEGGSTVLTRFLQEDLVDDFTVYVAPRVIGSPDAPRIVLGDDASLGRLKLASVSRLGEGALLRFAR